MADPIAIVGDRIRYWAERNNPKDGAGKFDTYWSKLRVEPKEIVYGTPSPASISPVTLDTAKYTNNTSAPNKQTFSVSKKTTETFSWSLKESISTKVTLETKIPFAVQGKTEVTVSFEGTQTTTKSLERTWTYSFDVNVPARKRVTTKFIVAEGHYKVPFWAKVRVRGKAWIKFANGKWWGAEISDMIDKLKWNPTTFDCDMDGTLDAVRGDHYEVETEEFDITSEAEGSSQLVDSGVMQDRKLYSDFAEMTAGDKGPEDQQ